ncbi:MAG: sortase family protein, LPXTG-site transpeptidase, partial [Candidatus Berkelbacteria bacterium Licking1014_85]
SQNALYLTPTNIIPPAATTTEIPPTNRTAPTKTSIPINSNTPNLSNDQLFIPKINVRAPINWNVDTTDKNLLNVLKTGLAHFNSTALPGESSNIFISGHSSYYWWDKGQYKRIFALLPELKINDTIYIKYKNTQYTYQVANVKVVPPTDVSVINPTAEPILSLMTCVPVGTAKSRLIVIAKQIAPTKSEKVKRTFKPFNKIPKVL